MTFLEIMGVIFLALIALGIGLFLAALLACACGFMEEDETTPVVEFKDDFHTEVGELVEWSKKQ